MTDWGWYKEANTMRVFLHLLITANYHESEYMGYRIARGQTVTGRKQLSESLNLSEREIRTALNHLKSTSEITIKSTNKFSIITVVKYGDYQYSDDMSDQQNDQQEVSRVTSKRPTNDHIQEIKNVRYEDISPYNPPLSENEPDETSAPFQLVCQYFENTVGGLISSRMVTEINGFLDKGVSAETMISVIDEVKASHAELPTWRQISARIDQWQRNGWHLISHDDYAYQLAGDLSEMLKAENPEPQMQEWARAFDRMLEGTEGDVRRLRTADIYDAMDWAVNGDNWWAEHRAIQSAESLGKNYEKIREQMGETDDG